MKVLQAFGFNDKFCHWIYLILHSAKLSFSVNGKPVGFFSCRRGVRQGDPLSPLLFCLAEDVLSRGITHLVDTGALTPMTGPKGIAIPSHILYADDIMVFCKGTRSNLTNLMALFHSYGQASGQLLGLDKCKFYVSHMTPPHIATLSSLLGFSQGHLPFTYLGVPLFVGKPKRIHLAPIVDKIKAKLSSWKGKLLSIMGRVQLVKSVIHGMLVYSFHIYSWPLALIKHLDQCIRNFIWSGDIYTRKVVTVAWSTMCLPLSEGGLGLRSLRSINDLAMLKLSWDILSSPAPWATFFRSRFLKMGRLVASYLK